MVTLSCAWLHFGCLPLDPVCSGPSARAAAAWLPLALPAPPARPSAQPPYALRVPGLAVPAGYSVLGVRAPAPRSASCAVRGNSPDGFDPLVDTRFSLPP